MSDASLTEEMEAVAAAAATTVHHAIQEHPFATVAAGLGAGYVLGAGLPSWLVRAGASIGTRAIMRQAVSAAVSSVGTKAASKATPEDAVPCPPSEAPSGS